MGSRLAIRLATPDDAPALAGLRYEFRSSIRAAPEPRDEFVSRCVEWMQPRLQASAREGDAAAWRCWVVARGDELMGHVWIELVERIPNPANEPELYAYLTNFYVREELRGAGVGGKMLTQVLAWCDANEVDMTFLTATERSRALYTRHGFGHRDDLLMRRRPRA